MFTHFRCMKCRVILPLNARVNKPWYGWNKQAISGPVNNFCCPECGSNDLVMRAPGIDQIAEQATI